MNGDSLVPSTTAKPTVFPFLNEEAATSNPDTINPSFSTEIMSKWAVKEPKPSKDAFPTRTFRNAQFHGKEPSATKNFNNRNRKEIIAKNYSCPSIVDMNNTIFYNHDVKRRDRPRRIIDGFFPNKIRSASGSVNGGTPIQHRTPTTQVGLCLGATRAQSVGNEPNAMRSYYSRSMIQRPKSIFTGNGHLEEYLDIRQSHSAWPVRNGSPSPWLERYKIKKRSTTSHALQKPHNCVCDKEMAQGTKRNQEYVNLSGALILDAF